MVGGERPLASIESASYSDSAEIRQAAAFALESFLVRSPIATGQSLFIWCLHIALPLWSHLQMSNRVRYNPVVLIGKTLFLQRLQEAVSDGYRYASTGTVPLAKATGLVRKFADLYSVHLDKNARYRRKAAGLGNARLVLTLNKEMEIDFALLVTLGEHPAHHLEKLADVTKTPLHYGEFELVAITLKGRDKPGLTWRLDAETVAAWEQRLHLHTSHYNRTALYQDWFSLYRVPGFAGVRRQVGSLVSFWRREWQKLRGTAPCPMCFPHEELKFRAIPGITRNSDGMYYPARGFPTTRQLPTLFYVRKQKDAGEPLLRLVRSLEREAQTVEVNAK
jgi:hypothetical protein